MRHSFFFFLWSQKSFTGRINLGLSIFSAHMSLVATPSPDFLEKKKKKKKIVLHFFKGDFFLLYFGEV